MVEQPIGRPGDPPSPSVQACPRCGGAFHCGIADPQPCACTTVKLDAATLQALRLRHDGCLCVACLQALARGEAVDGMTRAT